MNNEDIIKSDVLDILFEKRNKAYGAYELRKKYHTRLKRSLLSMLAIVIVFAAIASIPKNKKPDSNKKEFETRTAVLIPEAPKKKAEVKPAEPQKPQAAQKAQAFTTPVIVDKKEPVAVIKSLDSSARIVANVPKGPIGTGPAIVQPTDIKDGGGGKDSSAVKPVVVVDRNTPTNSPDVMPAYPGGMDALRRFLERNLQNPEEMQEGSMVSVRVKFVVGYDGKLKGFETVQDGGEVFNKEVIRVLKKMPEWIPGKTNGENVSVYYTIPVKFVPAE